MHVPIISDTIKVLSNGFEADIGGRKMDLSMMVTPDIASMSMTMAANKSAQDIGVAMLDKSLDNFRENGAEMVKMMEQSVTPYLGSNFDMSV